MVDQRHPIVINGIHEEVYKHLVVMKNENSFTWSFLLSLLLMAVEMEIDRGDKSAWLQGVNAETIHEDLSDMRLENEAGGFQIDKTKKRRKYGTAVIMYPERGGFRKSDE